jgi:putative ABC transport system permease protein
MNFFENIRESLNSVFGNVLRTVLTALIIAIGIMALVGILTSIQAVSGSLTQQFSSMGSNSFTFQDKGNGFHIGFRGRKAKKFPPIRYIEAMKFKNTFQEQVTIGITSTASNASTVKYENLKTDPNIDIIGGDENYLSTNGYSIAKGRNFSNHELDAGDNVVIIGQDIKSRLFKSKDPIDQTISIGNNPFRIVGIFSAKGSNGGSGGDKLCLIPLLKAKQFSANLSPSFLITVQVMDALQLKGMVQEATGWFRNIRHQPLGEEDSFDVNTSDELANQLLGNLTMVNASAVLIGIITLFGSSIALMNIMLVSVTERTREIGIRKAIGATPQMIQRQFLMEALVICQIGGITGVLLGILIGNLISLVIGGGFIIPWLSILGGLMICVFED